MKLGIPVDEDQGMESTVCEHFGQAPLWAVYDTDTAEVTVVANTAMHGGAGCQAVSEIEKLGADKVYVSGMGFKAIEKCKANGIEVKCGEYATVRAVVEHIDELEDIRGGCSQHAH